MTFLFKFKTLYYIWLPRVAEGGDPYGICYTCNNKHVAKNAKTPPSNCQVGETNYFIQPLFLHSMYPTYASKDAISALSSELIFFNIFAISLVLYS